MARNAEKAMTTLARWRAAQMDDGKTERKKRPFLTSECNDLNDAELFRRDIVRQISKKVAQIQNAGLGEFRIRDINDQINKLLREKRHWEDRIIELGGTNHFKRSSGPSFDFEGREVPGNRGYKYFGAAKDLPGVRELFSQGPPPAAKKTRAELMLNIDSSYYGYRDEDDGLIVPLEKEAETKARAEALGLNVDSMETEVEEEESSLGEEGADFIGPRLFVSHVPSVPSQHQVQQEILRRKKLQLLQELMPSDMGP